MKIGTKNKNTIMANPKNSQLFYLSQLLDYLRNWMMNHSNRHHQIFQLQNMEKCTFEQSKMFGVQQSQEIQREDK
ncbi:hypothetical protein FGO68_gene1701 [Halteria grandinella]|uniref:Uncharacterized protein n=1 Tax=Halteria grandinella TaxID=5974 RepID=A0A8J8SY15_HALGN|nr:hypothetical protein FGO68_gene1701 [Halteria grandinella]